MKERVRCPLGCNYFGAMRSRENRKLELTSRNRCKGFNPTLVAYNCSGGFMGG